MPTIRIAVLGKPAPKGSMKSYGRGRMVDSLKSTKPWGAEIVIEAARARDLAGWEMLLGAVTVECVAITPRPKSVKREFPIKRSAGDIDKLARNLLDALVNAHIMADDSQVIDLRMLKLYPRSASEVDGGMFITVSAFKGGSPNGNSMQKGVQSK